MRNRLSFEKVVNVLLALTCLVVLGRYGYQWSTGADARSRPPDSTLTPGQPAPGLTNVACGNRNIVLFARSTCRYCTDSMPFYKELSAQARASQVRFIAAGTEPSEVIRDYFSSHGVTPDDVISVPPERLAAVATPTLALVDGRGAIVRSWVGQLPSDAQAKVRGLLGSR
jgi:hypothetical protein